MDTIGLYRHNTSTGLFSQHIPFVMTLHILVTFIHTAIVSKLSNDVMITNHSLLYQKYCPDVSSCITSCISSANSQRNGWKHMTPWDIQVSNPSYVNTCHYIICNPSQVAVYIHTKTPWEAAIKSGDKRKTHPDSPFFVETPNPMDDTGKRNKEKEKVSAYCCG